MKTFAPDDLDESPPTAPVEPRESSPERASATGAPEVVDGYTPRWRLVVGVGVLVAVIGFAVWAQVDRVRGSTSAEALPRFELPSVAGLDQAAAQARLEELSFVVNVRMQPNDDPAKPRGMTFAQEPVAGSKVEQGDLVTIVVSDGPAGQTVPDVRGQQATDAQAVLASNGLSATTTTVYDEVAPVGEVLATDPEPGSRIGMQGTVGLVLSQGPTPRPVPEVVGQPLPQALAAIGRSGLNVGEITRVHQPGQPEGVVIDSAPKPGTPQPRLTPVALTVTGPPPKATVPTLVGLSQSTATSLVTRAGLVPEVFTRSVPAGNGQVGRVVSQNIPPFGEVNAGSTVQFVVGVAAAPTTTTVAAPP
ncbi:MAG TPA: PASTA domain-containing protein [Microthrixaceae bacterium]|nr:PASTA domain-containing protein [Microthrixaceae bacterium]